MRNVVLPPLPSVHLSKTSFPSINRRPFRFPTFNDRLCDQAARVEICEEKTQKTRRSRRKERRQLSSSSECLNYGPIDPPELLPDHIEGIFIFVSSQNWDVSVIEAINNVRQRRRPRTGSRKERHVRTSTPVGSDSAYSPSPVTDSNSNDEPASWSEPEEARVCFWQSCKILTVKSRQLISELLKPPQVKS